MGAGLPVGGEGMDTWVQSPGHLTSNQAGCLCAREGRGAKDLVPAWVPTQPSLSTGHRSA